MSGLLAPFIPRLRQSYLPCLSNLKNHLLFVHNSALSLMVDATVSTSITGVFLFVFKLHQCCSHRTIETG